MIVPRIRNFSRYGFLVGALIFSMTLDVQGQDSLNDSASIMLVYHEGSAENHESRLTIAHTAQALEKAFSAVGIQTLKHIPENGAGGIPAERLYEACLEAGVRWGLTVYTNFNGGRLFWRFSIYDAAEDLFRASDMFFVFLYAGVSSRNAIEQSAQGVAANWQKSLMAQNFDGNFAVQRGQQFTSSQEGVLVHFGDEEGPLLGRIEEGSLITPFFLFTEGAPIYGTVMKEGYWSKSFFLSEGITDKAVELPVLQKRTRRTFGFLYEFRGSNQHAFDMEYRYNILPDRFFLKLDWMFLIYPSTADKPLFAQELRLGPGLYLLPWRDLRVRLLAGLGASLVLPEMKYPQFLLYPLWLGWEYHFSQVALKVELRFPLLLYDSWYYSGPGDSRGVDYLGIYFAIGVMYKW